MIGFMNCIVVFLSSTKNIIETFNKTYSIVTEITFHFSVQVEFAFVF